MSQRHQTESILTILSLSGGCSQQRGQHIKKLYLPAQYEHVERAQAEVELVSKEIWTYVSRD